MRRLLAWVFRKLAVKIDEPLTTLRIPRAAPPVATAPRPEETITRLSKKFTEHSGMTSDHPSQRVMRTREVPDPVVTYSGTRLGETSSDGVTKVLKMIIMCPGSSILRAYETTRVGFPGIQYLVERQDRGQSEWRSKLTDNKNDANTQWFEWYDEIKKMNNNGFGGCSGTGLEGKRPF